MAVAESCAVIAAATRAVRADPLLYWRFAVERLRAAFAMYTADDPIEELACRSCNNGTKTQTGAAWTIACAQKRPTLDAVPVPRWSGRVECAQLVLDYKQQLLSVQPAYLLTLGEWPHHPRWNGPNVESLHVRPLDQDPLNDSWENWSVIHFLSQKNLTSGVGVRADHVNFDEPPVFAILDELRKAAHAGRRGTRSIMFTPTKRSQWAPLKADYGECPRSSLRRVDTQRAECRWSLSEVAEFVLSPTEKAALIEKYRRGTLPEAREHGDYTNADGSSPWGQAGLETLMQMLSECVEPEIVRWRVSLETDADDPRGVVEAVRLPVEVFRKPWSGVNAYLDIDPSSGIDDGKHHEAGLHVSEMGSGDLLARWTGYVAPWSLGALAAGLSRQYGGAPIDVEMKDHWGVNVVRGIEDATRSVPGVGIICHETRELRPGVFAKEAGYDATDHTRSIWIGCLQQWLDAWGKGVRYARCPSAQSINSLIDCELDDRGRVIAGPGAAHGVDMVLLGQKLRRAVTRSSRVMPEVRMPPRSPLEVADAQLAAFFRGLPESDPTPPFRQSVRRPRSRSRI